MSILQENLLKDVLELNLLTDLLGDAGATEVSNLLLEDGSNFLLEDGNYLLLE